MGIGGYLSYRPGVVPALSLLVLESMGIGDYLSYRPGVVPALFLLVIESMGIWLLVFYWPGITPLLHICIAELPLSLVCLYLTLSELDLWSERPKRTGGFIGMWSWFNLKAWAKQKRSVRNWAAFQCDARMYRYLGSRVGVQLLDIGYKKNCVKT